MISLIDPSSEYGPSGHQRSYELRATSELSGDQAKCISLCIILHILETIADYEPLRW